MRPSRRGWPTAFGSPSSEPVRIRRQPSSKDAPRRGVRSSPRKAATRGRITSRSLPSSNRAVGRQVVYPDLPDNFRTRLDLQWLFYTGGRLDALERAARAERQASGEELAAARSDLRLEITRAFWSAGDGARGRAGAGPVAREHRRLRAGPARAARPGTHSAERAAVGRSAAVTRAPGVDRSRERARDRRSRSAAAARRRGPGADRTGGASGAAGCGRRRCESADRRGTCRATRTAGAGRARRGGPGADGGGAARACGRRWA